MTERLLGPGEIEGDFDDITQIQDDIDNQIEMVIAEFGDEEVNATKLKVYKTIPNLGKMEWLFDCTPNELPIMERLRDEYGGGKYEARLYSGKPLKLKNKFEILIGEMKKQPIIKQDNNREMITVMMEGFNKLGELIAVTNVPRPEFNPMDMQLQMMQNMVAMKELMGGNQTPQESPIKMMTQLVEIQKTLGGIDSGGSGAGTADVLLSMVNNVLPKLAEMGEKEQQLKMSAMRKKPRLGNRKPMKPKQIQGNNPMKMHLIFLCAQAASGRDPMTYAQMVIDNTAPEKMAELKEFISGPSALVEMTQVHAAVGKHPEWFKELGACVVDLLDSDPILTNPPNSTINPVSDTIPGEIGTQTIAATQSEKDADTDPIIIDS